jgi:UDP-N-acetylmuramyl pentapeptide phosphotransferase/UDP-N-acetylglucosamine-1-phosphate transferase
MSVAVIILLVGLTSLVLTRWLARTDAAICILDQPNERSLHSVPMPRTGGIAICAALFLGWLLHLLLSPAQIPVQIIMGAGLVFCVSILDDRYGLPHYLRLIIQFGAALILIRSGFVIDGDIVPGIALSPGPVATLLTVMMSLWLINLYNFMDGMDGFAGGMTVIGFGALAILGWQQGDALFSGAAMAVCAAAAGFLWFNFPPARIFMGDSGSTTLGFLVAAFAIWASRRGIAWVWVTLVVFSPFVVDATMTLLRRAVRGERIWLAHRSHYYQRLVQLGWGHRRTVLAEYVVMLICAVAALAINGESERMQQFVLLALAVGYLCVAVVIHIMEIRRNASI